MAPIQETPAKPKQTSPWFDSMGVPWLENGERADARTFLERYKCALAGFKAELIEGTVFVASPLSVPHGRSDNIVGGSVFLYTR
jgi:hypothetical protein